MTSYMEVSAEIYGTYLRYVSQEDIHPYSIDECFIDATPYLELYDLTAREFADTLRSAVLARRRASRPPWASAPTCSSRRWRSTISAKHAPDGVGELDARSFRESIWRHRPITDIWNIGPGVARRLAKYRVFDLKGVTEMDPDVLYGEFGVNAEYLIDHAWGVEPCTIAEIKAYEPESSSTMNGQILPCGYNFDDTLMVLREMVDDSVLDLVREAPGDRSHLAARELREGRGWGRGGGRCRGGRRKGPREGGGALRRRPWYPACRRHASAWGRLP